MKVKTILIMLAVVALFCGTSFTALAGQPVGALVKSPNDSKLYIMVPVGKVAYIPTVVVLQCLKLQNRAHTVISQAELNSYPKTELLLQSRAGAIYMVKGDKKHHIANASAFQRRNLDPSSVLPMMDDQLNCLQDGAPLN